MFQEFDFEIVVKPEQLNAGLDHLSRTENGEEPTNIEDGMPNAQLFRVEIVDDYYGPIVHFLSTILSPADMSIIQKKHLVVKASEFSLIAGQVYKLVPNEILRRCVLLHE